MTPRSLGPALAAGAALLLTACSGGEEQAELPSFAGSSSTTSSAPPSSTTTSSPPTTSAPTALEGADLVVVDTAAPPGEAKEVFDAYVEFWQADMAALARSDPQWQPLVQRLGGVQKDRTLSLIQGNQRSGQKVTGTITIRPQVLVARGTAATVRDCLDLSESVAVRADGSEVADTRGSSAVAYSVALRKVDSVWTVTNIQTANDPTCA